MNTRKVFRPKLLLLATAMLWLGAGTALAQEPEQEEAPEVTRYREDYERYQKISAIKDPMKRGDALYAFLRQRRNSKLLKNAQVDYLRILENLHKEKKYAAIIPEAERFIEIFPRVGETYYLYGFALKEQGKPEPAMNALAKCHLLRVPASVKAKRLMEYIYKGQHNGSLAGLDEIIRQARTELGT
jgi:hypothetical protein